MAKKKTKAPCPTATNVAYFNGAPLGNTTTNTRPCTLDKCRGTQVEIIGAAGYSMWKCNTVLETTGPNTFKMKDTSCTMTR